MMLSKCIENLEITVLKGNLDREISHVAFDSRKIDNGGLFVAVSG